MDKILIGVLIFCFFLLVCLGIGSYRDATAWSRYSKEHHCVEIARHSNPPIYMNQVLVVGNQTILVPQWVPQEDTVTYRCDSNTVIAR